MTEFYKQAISFDEWRAAVAVYRQSKDAGPFWRMQRAVEAEADLISIETCQQFIAEWKLPNMLSPSFRGLSRLPSANLSTTDPLLLNRIKTVLRRQGKGKVCWACGLDNHSCCQLTNARDKPVGRGLAAHEFWAWDDERHVRTMVAIRFLCFDCHFLAEDDIIWTMLGLSRGIELRRIEKFCSVNQCSVAQMMAQVRYAGHLSEQRAMVSDWQVDLLPVQGLIEQANLRRGHSIKPRG